MINLLTGPPRAGKTYFVVYWLYKNYLKYDKDKLMYNVKNGALIVSNIDELRLPHKNLDLILKENECRPEEFSIKHPTIIYLIDEAHIYFPAELSRKSKIATSLREYFAYHGHYNQHFWLMTQDTSLIYQSIVKVSECEYQTVRSSLSPPGKFKYNMRIPGKMGKFNSVSLRKQKESMEKKRW